MKKILSLILTVCFLATVLVSCSSDGKDSTVKEEPNVKITYDSAYADYDESVINAYEQVCQAVIKGENDVRINTGMFSKIQRLIYTSFPLYDLVESFNTKSDGSGISIEYKNENEKHLELVGEFQNKVNEIVNNCSQNNANDLIYTINLYNYIATNIVPSENSSVTCYQTIMQGEGNSFTYSNMFEYLLAQKGISSYHIIAYDMANIPFGLSQAVIDGNLYYFDVMSEYYANEGKNLVYFGMTTQDVINTGLDDMTYTDDEIATDASDLEFDVCRSCQKWEISGDSLLITRADDEVVAIDLITNEN